MNRILLIVGVVVLFGCSSKPKQDFPIPSKEDINEIVKVILTTDTLSLTYYKVISGDLQKINVFDSEQNRRYNYEFITDKHVNELIGQKFNGKILFHKSDSLYLFFQNDTLRHFNVRHDIIAAFKITSLSEQHKKWKVRKGDSFTILSIPIFSLDQKNAYVSENHICNGLCGDGFELFLQKINGHWTIIKKVGTGVS